MMVRLTGLRAEKSMPAERQKNARRHRAQRASALVSSIQLNPSGQSICARWSRSRICRRGKPD